METAQLDEARQQALRDLLDDSSPAVRRALLAYFTALGAPALRFLQETTRSTHRPLARQASAFLPAEGCLRACGLRPLHPSLPLHT